MIQFVMSMETSTAIAQVVVIVRKAIMENIVSFVIGEIIFILLMEQKVLSIQPMEVAFNVQVDIF